MFEYAAKLVCGLHRDPRDRRLIRGAYATTINIHNPNDAEVEFFKKLALTFPRGTKAWRGDTDQRRCARTRSGVGRGLHGYPEASVPEQSPGGVYRGLRDHTVQGEPGRNRSLHVRSR
jgi:hypothetical protein